MRAEEKKLLEVTHYLSDRELVLVRAYASKLSTQHKRDSKDHDSAVFENGFDKNIQSGTLQIPDARGADAPGFRSQEEKRDRLYEAFGILDDTAAEEIRQAINENKEYILDL